EGADRGGRAEHRDLARVPDARLRLRGAGGARRRGGAQAGAGVPARPPAARRDDAALQRLRGLPAHARGPGDARGADRARAGARRRRLYHQAVLEPGAGRPGEGAASMTQPIAYVVDDDPSLRTLWEWLMSSNGIAVQSFASAAGFIQSYRRGEPGCLVLDVRLPGMSGPELQAYLRREAIEIPIVFVSAHGDVPTAVNALKGGAVDFIQKPFDYRDAVAAVRRALERDAHDRERRAKRELLAERLAALTERERGVLQRVVEGKANK